MKKPEEKNMLEVIAALYEEEDRVKVARCVVHFEEELARFSKAHGEKELVSRAEHAMHDYLSNRLKALDQIKTGAEEAPHTPIHEDAWEKYFKEMYNNIFYEDSLSQFTQSERCDRLYRFIQGIDAMINEVENAHSSPYTGPVNTDAEKALIGEVCERAAMLTVSHSGLRMLRADVLRDGTLMAGKRFARMQTQTLLEEAVALYMLAHEDKLSGFRSDITMEECVNYAAVMQDVDSLRRAVKVGEIGDEVAFCLTYLLVWVAYFAIFSLPDAFIALNIALGATGLMGVFSLVLAFGSLIVGPFAGLYIIMQEDFNKKLRSASGRVGSYITLMLPLKVRKLFMPKPDGNAPGASGAPVGEIETVQLDDQRAAEEEAAAELLGLEAPAPV